MGPAVESLLRHHRDERHEERKQARRLRVAAEQRVDAVPADLHRHAGDHQPDERRDDGLDLAVPVRVVLVGRGHPEPDAQHERGVGDEVGEGVHGVRQERLRRERDAAGELRAGDQQVDGGAGERHAPHPRDFFSRIVL